MHHDYCLLTGGLERALYRVARKHVGQQRGGCTCRLEVLREKTGSDATPKEFARMVRKIIEADPLPEYTMTITKTTEGAPAALFELRGAAEAAAMHAKRSEEHTSELQSPMRISYAVFCLTQITATPPYSRSI